MKTYIHLCCSFVLVLMLGIGEIPAAHAQQGDEVSFQEFYDELEPYGQWIDDPQYGYVWRPDAGNDFKPYQTNGHWTMTDYGNMWVSDYDWGWAPFHYGRWTLNSSYGWLWIPGTQWGPAWVDWRQGGGYYGWAPLGPGINININLGRRNYAPDAWWCFVPQRYVLNRGFYNYRMPYGRNVTIIRSTTIINNNYVRNNVRYVSGPRVGDIQRVTRQRVNVYNVGANNRPGATRITNNTVNVYRPTIRRNGNDNSRPAPERVVRNGQTVTNNRSPAERVSRSRDDRQGVVRPGANDVGRTRGGQANADRSSANRDNSRNRPERVMRSDENRQTGDRQRVERSQQMQQRNEQAQAERQQRSRDQQVQREQQSQQQNQIERQQRSQQQQAERQQQAQQRNQQMQAERQQRGQQQQAERQQQMQQRSQQQQAERQQRSQERPQRQQQARPERVERSRRG